MKVLIADDHPLMLVALRRALEADGGFDVVGEARVGRDVLAVIGRTAPEVVLLDLQMPGIDGLGSLDRIVDHYPRVKVITLSEWSDPGQIEATFKRGAYGYLVKTIDVRDLASAIRQAVYGTAYHASGLPALNDARAARDTGLTEREVVIVKGLASGLTNQEIAGALFVTEQTVKFHLTNVYRKLGIANRTEATRWAFERGLLSEIEDDLWHSVRAAKRVHDGRESRFSSTRD